jgi:hypothetical protein
VGVDARLALPDRGTRRLGDDTYAQLLARHHEIVRTSFGTHGGREEAIQGDSFFGVFGSTSSCIIAAIVMRLARAVAMKRHGSPHGLSIEGADQSFKHDLDLALGLAKRITDSHIFDVWFFLRTGLGAVSGAAVRVSECRSAASMQQSAPGKRQRKAS